MKNWKTTLSGIALIIGAIAMYVNDPTKLNEAIVGVTAGGRGYNFQKDWRSAKVIIGDTEIMHGMWYTTHSAHKHLTTLRRNVVFFHTHRFNTHLEGGLSAYNCGFGGDRTAPVFNYMSGFQKEAWTNSLAVINLGEDNISRVTAIPYNDGLFFNNKLYKND